MTNGWELAMLFAVLALTMVILLLIFYVGPQMVHARGRHGATGPQGIQGVQGATGPPGPVTGPGIGVVLRLGGNVLLPTGVTTPIIPTGSTGIVEYEVGNAVTYNPLLGTFQIGANGLYEVSFNSQMQVNGVQPGGAWSEWFLAGPTYDSHAIAQADAVAGIGRLNSSETLLLNAGDSVQFLASSTVGGQMLGSSLVTSPNRFSVILVAPSPAFP